MSLGAEIGIYIPISTLNCFFKIYEKFLQNQLHLSSDEFLSDFISAYRKGYSATHVLIRLLENRKTTLDKNLFTRAVLTNLSKVFDSVTHDLLITKPHAY